MCVTRQYNVPCDRCDWSRDEPVLVIPSTKTMGAAAIAHHDQCRGSLLTYPWYGAVYLRIVIEERAASH